MSRVHGRNFFPTSFLYAACFPTCVYTLAKKKREFSFFKKRSVWEMRLVVDGRRRGGEVNPICVASNARGGRKGGRERAFVVIANSITPYVLSPPSQICRRQIYYSNMRKDKEERGKHSSRFCQLRDGRSHLLRSSCLRSHGPRRRQSVESIRERSEI